MTVVNLAEKKEGQEGECPNCGAKVVCRMSNYKGGFENKLQWQNPDGKAHIKWLGQGKYECRTESPAETAPPPPSIPKEISTNDLSGENIADIIGKIHKIQQIEGIVRAELGRNPTTGEIEQIHDAKCGLYVKLILDMMQKTA